MTDTERRLAAAVWRGFASSPFVSLTERDAESIARTLLPVVAEIEAEARAGAVRDAADAWTQGEWSNAMLPKPTPPAVPVIAYSNRVGDWLRDRADALAPDPDSRPATAPRSDDV